MTLPRAASPRMLRRLLPPVALPLVLLSALPSPGAGDQAGLAATLAQSGLPVTEFRAPLNDEMRRLAGDGRISPVTTALGFVATPPGFDPGRSPRPVLVISATTDRGYNSSRHLLLQFARPALDAGWIVLAVDPAEEVSPGSDRIGLRHALLLAALDHLRREWPGMTRWPRAYAGFSGGAKISGYLAAVMTDAGQPPCGLYLSGCNDDTPSRAMKSLSLAREPFVNIPVFLSSGTEDRIATPTQHAKVKAGLLKTGFRHVELKSFTGGHEVNAAHIAEALRWFVELAAKK